MTGTSANILFDSSLVKHRHQRADAFFPEHKGLFDDVGQEIIDRLGDIIRPLNRALDISPFPFLHNCKRDNLEIETPPFPFDGKFPDMEPGKFDLVVSNLGMHWINDLPAFLEKCQNALGPEGVFLGTLMGGKTLWELRECLLEAEIAVTGGASLRFSPMIDIRTAGNLLKKTGFSLPAVDVETVTLLYKDIFALMHDLQKMGQTNAHVDRLRHPTRREIFFKASELYQQKFTLSPIPATFEVVFLHGWKLDQSL